MKKRVYAYLHTHWDMEWYRDKEDFDIRLVQVFDVVIDELLKDNAPYFYFDGQVVALLNYLKNRPEKEDVIKQLIKDKKLGIGPFYVSADTYLVNINSMLKNIDLGLKYSKTFGQKDFIGYICDVFGISNSIFEALKLKNIKNAIIWRGINPEKINNNCNFIKNNIKTLWLAQGYFNDYFNSDDINIEGLKNYIDKISKYSKKSLLLPIGADHLGILRNAKTKIQKINNILDDYEIILTSPFEYFKKNDFSNVTDENEFLDNSDTYILGGVYSSRINQKIKNAYLQNKISRVVEPLNFVLKQNYSKNIDIAYETLIQNHAHDGICGCSLDSVADTVNYRFNKCENILNSIEKNIIYQYKKQNKIINKSNDKLGLFNLSNSDDINVVEVELPYILKNSQVIDTLNRFPDKHLMDIYKVPVTEEITKHYKQLVQISKNDKLTYSVVDIIQPNKTVKVTDKSIENKHLKILVSNKKLELINKLDSKKVSLILTDIKDVGDTYNFAPKGKYKKLDIVNSKIKYDGDIQGCLTVKYKNIILDILLNNESKIVEFNAKIKNQTKNHKLQFVIKLNENISKTTVQDAIGLIERSHDCNYKMQDFMPAKRPIELKTNSYPMQNFVKANEILCLTKGLNEYEIYKNELRICLLRCIGTISNPKNPARAIPAGPNLLTPKAQMIGQNVAQFALSFENLTKAFYETDKFFKNYIVIDGNIDKTKKIKLFDIDKNEIFYGIHNNKKIIYNIKNHNIELK